MDMKKRINYLGFLSLLSLISILGIITDNKGLFGFLGFISYFHYFKVIPDELFMENLYKSCTTAFLLQVIMLVPLIFINYYFSWFENFVLGAMGMSFAIGLIAFTIMLYVLQKREARY